jgi:putative copper resistance protein D
MSGLMVFLHILGAAIWTGGLIFVGVVAVVSRRTLPEATRIEFFRSLGFGFLVLAGIAAALLALSGNLLVDDFGGWEAVGDTDWGELILWKTAIFAVVIALALIHALALGPRIRRLRESDLAGDGDATRALRRATMFSAVTQVLMLAGTIAILALAADLIT